MSALKHLAEKIYIFSCRFISVLSLLFVGVLLFCNFLHTCYTLDMETQLVLFTWDSPLWNLLGIAAFGIVFFLVWHFSSRKPILVKKLLFVLTVLWILGIGTVLILFSKTVPAADAWSVYDIAGSLAKGDTSVIHPTDSYLSYYPQQVGLVAFYEVLIRLWNLLSINMPAYHFIKGIYVLLAIVALYFQYRTVHFLFQNDRTDCIFLLLMGCNLPFIMYTSFVYGEIPSFAALSIGIYCFMQMIFFASGTSDSTDTSKQTNVSNIDSVNAKKRRQYAILALVFFTMSVQLRKNSLIFIIAVVLVSFFLWLHNRKRCMLSFAVLCSICAVSILPLIQKGYELRADNTLLSGVPAMSYFAMGMQEASRGDGWYNAFNFDTYQNSGMDTALANEISLSAISDRLSYFAEHPGYAAHFYSNKFLTQWTDGTYACRQATLATFGGRRTFFNEIYEGKYSRYFISYCNAYQNIICMGAFLFCLTMLKEKKEPKLTGLPVYLGLIGIFGGFLFHMIWEANSRYIFLYGMMLVPYAAVGIEALLAKLSGRPFLPVQSRENGQVVLQTVHKKPIRKKFSHSYTE